MVSPYYPNQVPWTDKENWVSPENPGDLVEADHVNQLYAEVNAIGQDVGAHKSESAIHKTSDVIRTETETKLKVEVVSSSVSETPDAGRIIFDTSQGKFFGGNGTEWV